MADHHGVSSSSSSSVTHPWTYNVFLSFRGEDTRNNFTDHLYSALQQKGISTFMDEEIVRGQEISSALCKAIEESMISIVIFSENYASSRWCLDELIKILECKKSKQQMVRPIFYKVDPSDVRNQKGSFAKGLAALEEEFNNDMEQVVKWRSALTEAANLSGCAYLDKDDLTEEANLSGYAYLDKDDLTEAANLSAYAYLNEDDKEQEVKPRSALTEAANLSGYVFLDGRESKFINKIVEDISAEVVNRTYLNVAKYPVGMQSRVQDVNKLLLGDGKIDTRMMGIWGIGGIGKTTLSKAVYNSIVHNFESSCFLANIREKSVPPGSLVKLQQTILLELSGVTKKLTSVDKGINVMRARLNKKKVLLILDDVSHLDQLNCLAGRSDWFGLGSRIIITTRDRRLLNVHQVNSIYTVKGLDAHEALELLSWNAFGQPVPKNDYVKLAKRATQYARGLPLALTVLGSHLCGSRMDEWRATLDSHGGYGIPNKQIQKILETSYNALEDFVKEVFLDIACFFNGGKKDYVMQILEACHVNHVTSIRVLIEKALITIENDTIMMHDLLVELGKELVRQESCTEPGERSRLWFHEDVCHVLEENTGTNKIKGIIVDLPKSEVICLSSEGFLKMKNLKFFINCDACLSGRIDYLPNELRFLHWPRYPSQSLPPNFRPRKLVRLSMPASRLTQLGKQFKNLQNLVSMNLDSCKLLTEIPDLTGMRSLKKLSLDFCTNLVEIHPSLGFLDNLVTLSLRKCYKLSMFPRVISLKSLDSINLEGCRRLQTFPKIVGKMELLRYMNLAGTGIRELPSSVGYLSGLIWLYLDACENLANLPCNIYELLHLRVFRLSGCSKLFSFPHKVKNYEVLSSTSSILHDDCGSLALPKLEYFSLQKCNLSECEFLVALDCLSTLRSLDLSGSNFVCLPTCISKFVNMWKLDLSYCKKLGEISELPPHLTWISLGGCESLERFSKLSSLLEHRMTQGFEWMDLSDCPKLQETLGYDVPKMASIILNQVPFEHSEFGVLLPGSDLPSWFSCRENPDDNTCELSLGIPQGFKWMDSGLALCAVLETTQNHSPLSGFGARSFIENVSIDNFEEFFHSTETTHVWLHYVSLSDKREWDYSDLYYLQNPKREIFRVKFHCKGSVSIKSCGIHLVCH